MAKTEDTQMDSSIVQNQQKKSLVSKKTIIIIVVVILWAVAMAFVYKWFVDNKGGSPGTTQGHPPNMTKIGTVLIPKWQVNIPSTEGGSAKTVEVELIIMLDRTKEEIENKELLTEKMYENELLATQKYEGRIVELVTVFLESVSYSDMTNMSGVKDVREKIKSKVRTFLNTKFAENGMQERITDDGVVIKTLRVK